MATTTEIVKSDQAISVAKHVDCERQCPYYYFPICATNGNPAENRMFVNTCEMHAWNCDVDKSKSVHITHPKPLDYRQYGQIAIFFGFKYQPDFEYKFNFEYRFCNMIHANTNTTPIHGVDEVDFIVVLFSFSTRNA